MSYLNKTITLLIVTYCMCSFASSYAAGLDDFCPVDAPNVVLFHTDPAIHTDLPMCGTDTSSWLSESFNDAVENVRSRVASMSFDYSGMSDSLNGAVENVSSLLKSVALWSFFESSDASSSSGMAGDMSGTNPFVSFFKDNWRPIVYVAGTAVLCTGTYFLGRRQGKRAALAAIKKAEDSQKDGAHHDDAHNALVSLQTFRPKEEGEAGRQ